MRRDTISPALRLNAIMFEHFRRVSNKTSPYGSHRATSDSKSQYASANWYVLSLNTVT